MATPSGSNSELFDEFHPAYLSSSGSTIRAPHASRPGKKASGSSAKRAPAPTAPVGVVGVGGVATSTTRDDETRSDPEEVSDDPGRCPPPSLSFGSSSTRASRDGLLDYAPSRRPSSIAGSSSRPGPPGAAAAGEARARAAAAAARRGAPARWGPYRLPGGRKGDIPAAGTGVRPRPRPLAPLPAPETAIKYSSFPPMVAEPHEEDVNYDASGSSDGGGGGGGGGGPIESSSESSSGGSSGGSSSLTLAIAQDAGRFRTCRPPPHPPSFFQP